MTASMEFLHDAYEREVATSRRLMDQLKRTHKVNMWLTFMLVVSLLVNVAALTGWWLWLRGVVVP